MAVAERGSGELAVRHFAAFAELVAWRSQSGGSAAVGVDVPIGLTDDGSPRRADRLARARLGRRSSSVFSPPGRVVLDAAEYAEVQARVAAARERGARAPGLSRQAFAILPKIREVDDLLPALPDHERWLVEVHPEVSFRAWADRDLAPKSTALGAVARIRLVEERFPALLFEESLAALGEPGVRADLGDLLDAAAALWSAQRFRAGEAEMLGGDERDARGTAMRIVV